MDITNVGTGNMGKALTMRAVKGGHRLTLLGTSPDRAQGVVEEHSADVELEALGSLHMAVQGPLGTGFASTVKVLS